MIVLTGKDVEALLPMTECIEVVERAMIGVSRGEAELPLRSVVPVGGPNRMGVMPGALSEPACFGVKLISLFPGNPAQGLSSHRGAYVLFEAETGGAVAMMDSDLLTAVRTAAASAVATRALAREDATRLAIIGTGEQAWHHLDAICAVRPITHVQVAGRSDQKAADFVNRAQARHTALTFTPGTDVKAAVAEADIVCTVTASPTPILAHAWLPQGVHVNVVGSSIPTMREVDDDFVLKTSIWVDYLKSTVAQAGEIVDLIAASRFSEDRLRGEIGRVLAGDLPGREGPTQQTAYRSLGVAAQDLAAAHHVYVKAERERVGQTVSL